MKGIQPFCVRGAAQIPLTSGQEAGYLVITMTRADFHQRFMRGRITLIGCPQAG